VNTNETRKAETIKRCLASARQLGMDLAYLLPCDLSGVENQLLRSAYGNIDDLLKNLDGIGNGKERDKVEERPAPEQKREHGSLRL
jgi:hypothetical protein